MAGQRRVDRVLVSILDVVELPPVLLLVNVLPIELLLARLLRLAYVPEALSAAVAVHRAACVAWLAGRGGAAIDVPSARLL